MVVDAAVVAESMLLKSVDAVESIADRGLWRGDIMRLLKMKTRPILGAPRHVQSSVFKFTSSTRSIYRRGRPSSSSASGSRMYFLDQG